GRDLATRARSACHCRQRERGCPGAARLDIGNARQFRRSPLARLAPASSAEAKRRGVSESSGANRLNVRASNVKEAATRLSGWKRGLGPRESTRACLF